MSNQPLNRAEVLLLGLAVMERFRCRKIPRNRKPDAHSWAVEQDFLSGVETVLKLVGRRLPEIVLRCREKRKSITLLTPADFQSGSDAE